MHVDPRIRGEPVTDLDAFVGGVLLHDQVQVLVAMGAGDLLEEGQALLMAVTRLARRGDLPADMQVPATTRCPGPAPAVSWREHHV